MSEYEGENNEENQQEEGNEQNLEELQDQREYLEAELGIGTKITPSERVIQMKQYAHVEELGGLEIDSDLTCDLEEHDNEKILMVCTSTFCDAPRRLCCGYCNALHSSHSKSLRKLNTFRDHSLQARVSLTNTLADFTQFEKKQLVHGLLVQLIKAKQQKMLDRFVKFQLSQYNSMIKLLDGATESYLFDEMALLKQVGGFHTRIEDAFAKTWPELKQEDVMNLIRLHENLGEYEEPVKKLSESRERLSRKLMETVGEVFEKCDEQVNQLEFNCENLLQDELEKVYSKSRDPVYEQGSGQQEFSIIEKSGKGLESNKSMMSLKQSSVQSSSSLQPQKELLSILLKDGHAPKIGWKSIQTLPAWAKNMKYVEVWTKKAGVFKRQTKDLPNSMDFANIGPLEDTRGDIYTGQWRQGLRWGHGILIQKDGTQYEGAWHKSRMEGYGRKIFRNGNMYEGEFKEDKMNGKGIYYHVGGSKYEGEWKDDHPHGRGIEYMINNDVFEGEFKKGLKEGKGKLKGKDGSLITGVWKEGKIQGKGEQLYADGRLYSGDFKDDKKEGHGTLTWNDGRKYDGPWLKGKQHGIGLFANPDGTKNKGEWINGNRIRWIAPGSSEQQQQ